MQNRFALGEVSDFAGLTFTEVYSDSDIDFGLVGGFTYLSS